MKSRMKIFWFTTFHKKDLFGSKPLRIRFDETDGFIKICERARCYN